MTVDRNIYGDGHLLEGIRSCYEDACASLCSNGEPSDSSSVGLSVRQECIMSQHGCSVSI